MPSYPLYIILDPDQHKGRFLPFVEEVIQTGAKIVQLRVKNKSDKYFYRLGKEVRRLTKGKSLFIINDRIDLAISLSADGLHLGQDDLPLRVAKQLLPGKVIGISCHNKREAIKAEKEGASYIGIGPIFETETKEGREPLGLEIIKEIKGKVKIPLVAIGGIKEDNIKEVLRKGADYAAIISAISKVSEPKKTVKDLLSKIKKFKK